MRKRIFLSVSLILVLSMLVIGCDTLNNPEASGNVQLKALQITDIEGTPVPVPEQESSTAYIVNVPYNIQEIVITVETVDEKAVVKYLPPPPPAIAPETSSTVITLALEVGPNVITITVTAEDGSEQDYTITVIRAPASAKAVTAFTIGSTAGTVMDETIAVTVPFGTDITRLAPTVAYTGSSVSPASGVEQNFTNPVTYRVTAGDGSTKDYTVTVQIRGQAPVTVSFEPLPYQEIDLTPNPDKDLSRMEKDTLAIEVKDTTAVRWFINGKEQPETDGTITIQAIQYPIGKHHVTALVYKDGTPYSSELIFKVVE